MPKMASYGPFGHLQLKLWAKEGLGVKLPVWLPTTKSRESTSSRRCLKECDTTLESFRRELQLWFKPHPIQVQGEELWMSKVLGLQPGTVSRLQLGSPRKKSHSDVASSVRRREYYMGEGGGFPESGPWWVLCVKVPVACPNTQGYSWMLTNLLVVGFGCRFELDNLILLLSLISGLLARPSTPF
jgi:hypothetical protein